MPPTIFLTKMLLKIIEFSMLFWVILSNLPLYIFEPKSPKLTLQTEKSLITQGHIMSYIYKHDFEALPAFFCLKLDLNKWMLIPSVKSSKNKQTVMIGIGGGVDCFGAFITAKQYVSRKFWPHFS